jgi:hypothetical protein
MPAGSERTAAAETWPSAIPELPEIFDSPIAAQRSPGTLFYPSEVSRIFERYWDYLPNLSDHPNFGDESAYTQSKMLSFSTALCSMGSPGSVGTLVTGDAPSGVIKTIESAAFSRLHQIYEGHDYWQVLMGGRSSPVTGSCGSADG